MICRSSNQTIPGTSSFHCIFIMISVEKYGEKTKHLRVISMEMVAILDFMSPAKVHCVPQFPARRITILHCNYINKLFKFDERLAIKIFDAKTANNLQKVEKPSIIGWELNGTSENPDANRTC